LRTDDVARPPAAIALGEIRFGIQRSALPRLNAMSLAQKTGAGRRFYVVLHS
jgi:hypothetical protein